MIHTIEINRFFLLKEKNNNKWFNQFMKKINNLPTFLKCNYILTTIIQVIISSESIKKSSNNKIY